MFRFSKTPKSAHSDEELLNGYRRTRKLAWLGMLYERYTEMVYGVCLKYLQDEADAEDAVMAVFEELVDKTLKHDIKSFRPWLYVLVKNHCFMVLRKQNKNITDAYEPHLMYSQDKLHPLDEEYAENPGIRHLEECVGTLNDQQKTCVEQFYFQGKSYKEIAEEQGLLLGRVRSHIQNGRRNLRLCIEQKAEKEE